VLKRNGLYFAQAVIWVKPPHEHPVLTRKDFMGNLGGEWCFYGWKEGAAHRFFGPSNVPDVGGWSIKKVNPQSMVHLTEKPVELARRAIEFSSRPGENVLDLFGGSGSTLIGAEMTGRRVFLMELDTLYCDVIVQPPTLGEVHGPQGRAAPGQGRGRRESRDTCRGWEQGVMSASLVEVRQRSVGRFVPFEGVAVGVISRSNLAASRCRSVAAMIERCIRPDTLLKWAVANHGGSCILDV